MRNESIFRKAVKFMNTFNEVDNWNSKNLTNLLHLSSKWWDKSCASVHEKNFAFLLNLYTEIGAKRLFVYFSKLLIIWRNSDNKAISTKITKTHFRAEYICVETEIALKNYDAE